MNTLEPLIECVCSAMKEGGWQLSGLQKTTSFEYEGPWEGSSVRSAYAFFHQADDDAGTAPSVEVFLDETHEGLEGNLSLVMPGPPPGEVSQVDRVVRGASTLLRSLMPTEYPAPVSVSYHNPGKTRADGTRCSVRFKARIPRPALEIGEAGVRPTLAVFLAAYGEVLARWRSDSL